MVDPMECMPSKSTADTVPPPDPTPDPPPSASPMHTNCMICASKIPDSKRGCCDILQEGKRTTKATHKPLLVRLGNILGVPLSQTEARSHMVCKKCFKQLNDVVKVEVSLESMKDDIRCKYNGNVEFWEKLESGQPDGDEQVKDNLVKGKVCRREQNQPEVDTSVCEGCTDGHLADGDFDFDEDEVDEEDENDDSSGADPPLEGHGRMKCHECPRSFMWSKWLSDHMSMAHGESLYACEVCLAEFNQGSSLQSHLEEHAAKGDAFICFPCERSFQDLRKYQDHIKRHWCRKYGCGRCGRMFYSHRMLQDHANAHDGVRPYQCPVCNLAYPVRSCLKAHLKVHQEEVTPAPCLLCGKAFLDDHLLKQHKKAHALEPDYTVCQQCGQGFSSANALEVHQMSAHFEDKSLFQCNSCSKNFNHKENYITHMRIHKGERPFQCDECGVRFSHRPNLRAHKRAKHYNDPQYRCEDCNISYMRHSLLVYHNNRVHTGERPYKCEHCNTTFAYPNHYKKHLKIHTREKLHKCEICGMAFSYSENRNTHRFTHSDKKPYECKVCGKGYMRKPLLFAHMNSEGHIQDIIIVNKLQIHHVDGADEAGLSVKQYDVEVGQESTNEGLAVAEDDLGDSVCIAIDDGLQLQAMEEAGDGVPRMELLQLWPELA